MIIKGNTVGTTMPRANWDQTDPKKADYIKGKEAVDKSIDDLKEHSISKKNPHSVTPEQIGARPLGWTPTADEVGARSNTWLPTILDIGAQAQHRSATVTLAAAGWVNNKQTVAVDFATSSNTIFPSPDPAHYELYVENGVIATAQANGSVTFLCERVPDADIVVNLAIFAEGIGGAGKVTAIDFTNFLNGSFTEVVDGETYTHSVSYDEATGVMQIDDITITFPAEGDA